MLAADEALCCLATISLFSPELTPIFAARPFSSLSLRLAGFRRRHFAFLFTPFLLFSIFFAFEEDAAELPLR